MFLLVLKDYLDLDKVNYCKDFLLIWLLFVVLIACFTTKKAGLLNSSSCHLGNDSASAVVSV